MSLGVDPREVEGTTLTQSELLPASAVGTVKLTSKLVEVSTFAPLGVATTLVTPPDGDPMV
jgi:hypothetical protein